VFDQVAAHVTVLQIAGALPAESGKILTQKMWPTGAIPISLMQ
jgi:hypothetical protein